LDFIFCGSAASRGLARRIPSVYIHILKPSCCRSKKFSNRLCSLKKQTNLHPLVHLPILILPRLLIAPSVLLRTKREGLPRRRGHVRNGNPA
jgi:hypothetical protein